MVGLISVFVVGIICCVGVDLGSILCCFFVTFGMVSLTCIPSWDVVFWSGIG